MAVSVSRTYGSLKLLGNLWVLNEVEPHVCIKLKAVFSKIAKGASQPFMFTNTPEACNDLVWFTERYPLQVSESDTSALNAGAAAFISNINDLESIKLPTYKPIPITLRNEAKARDYQMVYKDTLLRTKRILNGDDIGLGKTLEAILTMLHTETLPCIVVVQTHLPFQWKEEIEYFTNLRVHIMKGTKPYDLPAADVYITKYSCLAGWVDVFSKKVFKSVIFDEVQELRRMDSAKYRSAKELSEHAEYCQGLSASPIYNYGIELWAIMNIIKPHSLGTIEEFIREWTGRYHQTVADPKALGSYLIEKFLMIRRTRKDVGRELPPVNTIVHTVGYDDEEVQKAEELASILAVKVTSGSFAERGQAARELDILVRHNTGVAKAKGVAEYVKILLENKVPIILAAWHRDVYDILLHELKAYKPVMYTGSETPTQKEAAKQAFVNGETDCFILSLRSGIGLDGLQDRCSTVVIAELDWSPQVHYQIIGRANRENANDQVKDTLGNKESVTAIYLVADCGSDPPIIDLLGIKTSQHEGIMNPLDNSVKEQYSDESRLKLLAQRYLDKRQRSAD